ncbi:hypothetical protein CPI02_08960 [Moraxella catarrhalis]|uniref:hypothetical protein n=1 Tax=Moraxella catarrhalis TaxID=480 RepID=UPI00128BA4B1|nr:hypothetical protein [Moraxella catarrhalis]MPW71814.1 hypothetical protein [Moraxella catarrhalis]
MNYFIACNDADAAKFGASNFIDGDTAQVVKITQAYYTQNDKGTQTLHLSLISSEKQTGDVAIHFANGQGERLIGYNLINAILKVTGTAGITQAQGTYSAYDFNAGGIVNKQGMVAPELVGKFFGAIFSKNYRINDKGEEKYSINLFGVYHAQTQQWAKQMINGEQALPGQIDQMLERAKAESEKSRANPYGKRQTQQVSYQQNSQARQHPQSHVQLYNPPVQYGQSVSDDDMPF